MNWTWRVRCEQFGRWCVHLRAKASMGWACSVCVAYVRYSFYGMEHEDAAHWNLPRSLNSDVWWNAQHSGSTSKDIILFKRSGELCATLTAPLTYRFIPLLYLTCMPSDRLETSFATCCDDRSYTTILSELFSRCGGDFEYKILCPPPGRVAWFRITDELR